jgi:AhpD family alkylhydroperoxidase
MNAIAKEMSKESKTMYSMDNLRKLPKIGELSPDAMTAFWAYDKAALADGAIPKKYKELMAIAVALTTQCSYCIELHRQAALKAGVTEQELAETVHVAVALRAGGGITHGTHLFGG